MTITIPVKGILLGVGVLLVMFGGFILLTWPLGYCFITGQSIWRGCYWPPMGWS